MHKLFSYVNNFNNVVIACKYSTQVFLFNQNSFLPFQIQFPYSHQLLQYRWFLKYLNFVKLHDSSQTLH